MEKVGEPILRLLSSGKISFHVLERLSRALLFLLTQRPYSARTSF
jgi:hypothetical protein